MKKNLILSIDIKSDQVEFYENGLVKFFKHTIDAKGKIKRTLLDKLTLK